MSANGPGLPEYLFIVQLGEGRYFPFDHQRLFCVATFNGDTRQTGLNSAGSPSAPAWNARLEWRLSAVQLRSLEASGSHCKVTFAREDGRRVGWVVCDLRTAKLHAKHPKRPAWWAVAGPFKGKDTPEVLLYHALLELPTQILAPSHCPDSASSHGVAAMSALPGPSAAPAAYTVPHPTPAAVLSSVLDGSAAAGSGPSPGSGSQPPLQPAANAADVQLLQQASTLSRGMVADGTLRRFDFCVDLREFQAGRRLPLNLASVVVQLSLPQEFVGLILQSNGRLPPRLAPLRTQPPVGVSRGTETALPGGQVSVQFTAGLMALATVLARSPVMTVEVWHRERLSQDILLGRAHVPLSPLLQESWVDGRAGVFANLPAADGADGEQEERVQVGTLHLVMSLEEVGPALPTAEQPLASHAPSPRHVSPRKAPLQQQPSSLSGTPRHGAPHPRPLLQQQGKQQGHWQGHHPAMPSLEQQPQQQQPAEQPGLDQGAAHQLQQSGPSPQVVAEPQPRCPPDASGPPPMELLPICHRTCSQAVGAAPAGLPDCSPSGVPAQTAQQEEVSPNVGAGTADAQACRALPEVQPTLAPEPPPPTAAAAAQPPVSAAAAAGRAAMPAGAVHQPGDLPAAVPAAAAAPVEQPSALQALAPEIEAAWELEMWKRQEEERWKAELRQREAERMAALESEWRRREWERESEHAALRQEYASMQSCTQQVLAAAEEREKKVLAAEEGVARRRRELEREHAARVGEAEAAVRRVQMEFEHQLEMERLRTRQLQHQAAAAEEKAAAAELRAAAAERALQEHKEEHSRSPVGLLERELGEARASLAEAEQQAARAGEAKRRYKEQVVRLAQEVSALQRHLAEVVGLRREQLDAEVVRLAAQEAAMEARRDARQLGTLRQELRALQLGGGGGKDASAHDPVLLLGSGVGGEEVHRLLQEREELLSSGAYSREDPLIRQLEGRIRECAAAACGASGGAAAAPAAAQAGAALTKELD